MESTKRPRAETAVLREDLDGADIECKTTQALVMVMEDPKILEPPLSLPDKLVEKCRKGDVLLICKGNKAVQCHSQILAFASDVLDGMLESKGVLKGSAPVQIPVAKDDAADWLQVLVYLYPMKHPTPAWTPAQAMSAAVLSHKYDITSVKNAFEEWLSHLNGVDPCTGLFRWVVTDFSDCLESTSTESPAETRSPTFEAAGSSWQLEIQPKNNDAGEVMTHLSAFLSLVSEHEGVECKETVVSFAIALVSEADPVTHAHVKTSTNKHVFHSSASSWGWSGFISKADLYSKSKGYTQNNCIELLASVVLERASSCDTQYFLSSDPTDDLYVFKWLELGWRVRNSRLQDMCIEFIRRNAFQSVFDEQFGEDLHTAMKSMTPGQMINIMRSMQE